MLNPVWVILFFALLGSSAFLFGLPEAWSAGATITFFTIIAVLNPINGIIFLFLSTPFFLGESGWPYYWLTEALIFINLLSVFFHTYAQKEKFEFPLKYIFILFAIVSLLSLPIDGKEFYYDFWATSWGDIFAWWHVAHPTPKLHYVRILTNTLSGLGLFYIAYSFASQNNDRNIQQLFKYTLFVAGAICLIGILMANGSFPKDPDTWRYLTLSLVGEYLGYITAFSFALHFFNQYLLIVFPIALLMIFLNRKQMPTLILYIVVFGLMSYCLMQGGLRSSAALFYLMLTIAIGGYIFSLIKKRQIQNKNYIVAGFIAFILIAAYLLTSSLAFQRLSDEIISKFDSDTWKELSDYIDDPLYFMKHGIAEPRFFLWHTAVVMFLASPLLGIGLGRYTALFKDYYASDWYNWENIGFAAGASAHSFYFEILANQGIIGVLLWGALIFCILWGATRAYKHEPDTKKKYLIIAIFSSVIVWLLLGVTHHITLCRAIEIFFWIQLGLLAGLSADYLKNLDIGKKVFAAVLIVIAIAGLYQLKLISDRPIGKEFSIGFYNWEKQPDGTVARWAGKRAALNIKKEGRKMTLTMSAPLPFLDKNPQTVKIWFDDYQEEAVFKNTDWQDITIPVKNSKGSAVLWIETSYALNPKKEKINSDERNLGVMMKHKIGWE